MKLDRNCTLFTRGEYSDDIQIKLVSKIPSLKFIQIAPIMVIQMDGNYYVIKCRWDLQQGSAGKAWGKDIYEEEFHEVTVSELQDVVTNATTDTLLSTIPYKFRENVMVIV